MDQWRPVLEVADGAGPVFVRLAEAISRDIERGRLRPGQRLPGSRALAASLDLHRNTVIAAFDELRSQGWLEARHGSGTFVAEVPAAPPRARPPQQPGYALHPPPEVPFAPVPPRGVLELAAGRPDLRLLPVDELARAWRTAVRTAGRQVLGYGDPRGLARLREALATYLASERGLDGDPDQVLVTRGAQMALYLVALALFRPGDRVAVEALGYPPAWAALRATGAELVPIPVDDDGLVVEALERAGPLRAVYLTPHHQFPTMAVLPAQRRLALLELARRRGLVVIEDDYDHEHHFHGRPVLPLAHLDHGGSVVYVGTLSKVLAPGLRVGYVVAPPAVIEALLGWRVVIDRQGDHATEHALASLLVDGGLRRHLRRMRRVYAERQAHVADLLGTIPELSFRLPPGGLALWVGTPGLDVTRVQQQARRRDLWFDVARRYAFDGQPRPFFRLGFASHDRGELTDAIGRLRAALTAARIDAEAG